MMFCMFGVSWVMPQTTYDLLHCWRRKGPAYVVWNAIPSYIMWLLWRERNQRAFEDAERHSAELKLILIRTRFENPFIEFYMMEILQLFRGNVFGGSRTKVVVFSWKAN